MSLRDLMAKLPTMQDVQASRTGKPIPKGKPHILAKEERIQEKADKGKAFRDDVWKEDKGRCRATKKLLKRSGTMKWDELGEVDHSIPRSLAPDQVYDVSNALLLQKRLNRLRKVPCIRAPEFKYFDYTGPSNRRKPQHFIWRNDDGQIVKECWG